MKVSQQIIQLRKKFQWSQNDLASKTGISQVMVGKYERGDAVPSIEVAKNIADAFGVSLDFLAGEGINASFDKKTMQRIKDIQKLDQDTQNMLFKLIDTVIRDTNAKKAYNS